MFKTIVLAPGAVTAGNPIPIPAALREGKKITRVLSATIIRLNIDFGSQTASYQVIDASSNASTDGENVKLAQDTTALDILVLVVELDYEPGVTE